MNITAQPDPIEPGDTVTVCLVDLPEPPPDQWDIDVEINLGPGETDSQTLTVDRGDTSNMACTTWIAPADFTGATFTGPGGEAVRVSVAG